MNSIFKCLQEKRREKEQTATQVATKLAEEASYANMAQDLSNEVCETSEPFCNSLFNGRRCFFFFCIHRMTSLY